MKIFFKILFNPGRTILILAFSSSSLYAQWTSGELSVPRKYLAATTVGTKALFAGGNNPDVTNFAAVDIYDYITGQWTTHALSKGRHELAATSSGTKAFFAGGVDPLLSKAVDVYDDSKATNQWSTFNISTPRAHLGIAAAAGKVFFAGGQVSCGSCYTDNVEVYDINSNQMVSSLTLRVARGYLIGVAVGDKVFFAGGLNGSGAFIDDVDIYDMSTGNWIFTDLPSGGRSHLTAVRNGTKVFFAGGRNGSASGASDAVDIYDAATGDWLPSKTLSQARGYIQSASVGDKVFFGGGFTGLTNLGTCDIDDTGDPNVQVWTTKTCATFDIYDVTNDQMLPALNLPGGKRFSLAATHVGETQVVFAGGAGPCNIGSAAIDIYDIDPLVKITGTSFPEELSPGDKISITVDAVSKVGSVKAYVRGVSDPDGEFVAVGSTANASSFENIPDLSDEIGVVYFFEIKDKYGRILRSDTVTSYNRYPAGSPRLNINGLDHGDTESDYQIISVPLELDDNSVLSVFDELEEYNIKKWRLYDFNNNDNREYPGFTTIVPGKGYWLITKNAVSLSTGAGATARKSRGQEFEMTLPSGWSLIGNPYNFKISWTDIQDHNPGFSESQKLKVFSNGTLEETLTIDKYRGAFAYNSNASVTVKIPAKRNTTLSGRIGMPEEIDLDAANWQLLLELTDGSFSNRLGGIGMNKKASLSGLDEFDGLSVPMIEGIGMPAVIFAHPETKMNFSREVVPTQGEYIWDMEIQRGSDKTLTLQWSNEHFKESQQQLFLYDPTTLHMVDMKIRNSYILPATASSLQVIMGGPEFMNKKRDELMPLFGNPYPNPAADKVYIPFWIPAVEREMEISVKVYNMLGAEVKTLAAGVYQSGGHELVLDLDGGAGMYLVHMKANDRHNKWTKVTVR